MRLKNDLLQFVLKLVRFGGTIADPDSILRAAKLSKIPLKIAQILTKDIRTSRKDIKNDLLILFTMYRELERIIKKFNSYFSVLFLARFSSSSFHKMSLHVLLKNNIEIFLKLK